MRLVSDIGAKRAYSLHSTRKVPGVGGVGKQTGTNHEVSHFERKALKTYESFFWLTSNQALDTKQFAKRPTGVDWPPDDNEEGRLPPASDPSWLWFSSDGLSYRRIARNMGLSKNTMMGIVKQSVGRR